MRLRVADKIVGKSTGRGQKSRRECGSWTKKSVKVRVMHKVVDHGVAPERDSDREAYPKKAVDLVKNKSKKV